MLLFRKASLSARLMLAAEFVRPGGLFADIGTDHAALPAYLVSKNICPGGWASDINNGPLVTARKNLAARGLLDKVELVLCPGLEKIPLEKVDTVIIAGMGGDTIASILGDGRLSARHRLVLQPMTKAGHLRRFLFENGFKIEDEALAEEGARLYNIIVAAKADEPQSFDEFDVYVGRALANRGGALFERYVARRISRLSGIARALEGSKYTKELERVNAELELFKGVEKNGHGR